MSRLSTGNGANVGEEVKSDLAEIIAELRNALGAIPEVAKVYGKPEGTLEVAEEESAETETAEQPRGAYSTSIDTEERTEDESSEGESKEYVTTLDSLRAEQPKGAYSTPVLEEVESLESEAKHDYVGDLKLNPESSVTSSAKTGSADDESKEEDSAEELIYVSDLSTLEVEPSREGLPQQPSVPKVDLAASYEKARKEIDIRLAKLAKFLPDKVREGLDKKFAEAVKLAKPKSDEGFTAATEALTKLQSSLDSKAPELRTSQSSYLRKEIKHALETEGGVLVADDKKELTERFATLDNDLPSDEAEAKTQLEALEQLSSDVKNAIHGRLKAISDLSVDFERLAPIVERALSIKGEKHDDLEKANAEVKDGFAGQFVKDGLKIDEIQVKLTSLEIKLRESFKDFTLDDAKEEQKKSLPATSGSLKPKGAALGRGAFGEVYELKNDGDQKLVGKSFSGDNLEAKKEMEHEAEIYARIGEHPNIAKCYGIHEVDGKSMLVMDKIEGQDVEKVFKDLHKRLKTGKISREEYLAATQHLIKGTLMGLAHMEAMGLVHKDIKGDNVKFDTRTNQALLIDMGLAQSEGEHENPKNYFLIAPPEQMAGRKDKHDKVVTNLWDTFTVGKLLFEEMEREADGEKNLLVTGGAPIKQDSRMPSMQGMVQPIVQGSRAALKRGASGELEAPTDAKGELVGQALKKADTPHEGGKAGKYGAMTQYVDFMNRLTHPDPKQRMTTTEALKHPFMTDTFMSGEELDKVFGVATSRQKPDEEVESEEESGDEGPRLDTDALAAAYNKKSDTSRFRAEPLEEDEDDEESDEESKGPRIDTDALAEAYKKGEQKKYDSLLSETAEDESDEEKGPRRVTKEELDEAYFGKRENKDEDSDLESEDEEKGPRIDTDALAEAYSGKKSADDEFDSMEDESEEKKAPYDLHRGKDG